MWRGPIWYSETMENTEIFRCLNNKRRKYLKMKSFTFLLLKHRSCVGWIWRKLLNHNFSKKHVHDFGYWWILNKMNFSKKCHFLPKKCIFWRKMAFSPRAPQCTATLSRNFFFGSYFYTIFWRKILEHFIAQNFRPIFLFLPTHFWPYLIKICLKNEF